MAMRSCLNTITLGPDTELEESLRAASEAGFGAVELFSIEGAEGYAAASGMHVLKTLLSSLSLDVVGFVLGGFVYQSEREFADSLPGMKDSMSLAMDLGATNALLFIPSKGEISRRAAREMAARRIGEAADIAGDYGLTIGLEPIGKVDYLNTPGEVYSLMREVDARNVALTIDIFHFFTGGCRLADLEKLDAGDISLVHIDDAPDLPVEELEDSKRVLPGKGDMDVVGFLSKLKSMGYDAPLSVEIFSRDLWGRPPSEVARMAKECLDSVAGEAGI